MQPNMTVLHKLSLSSKSLAREPITPVKKITTYTDHTLKYRPDRTASNEQTLSHPHACMHPPARSPLEKIPVRHPRCSRRESTGSAPLSVNYHRAIGSFARLSIWIYQRKSRFWRLPFSFWPHIPILRVEETVQGGVRKQVCHTGIRWQLSYPSFRKSPKQNINYN